MSLIKNLRFDLDATFSIVISHLELADRGVTAIMGKSGSGKTTLLRILTGQYNAKNWSWIFNGIEMQELSMSERRLGVVFQSYDLFPHLTSEENILIVLKARNRSNCRAEALERMKLLKEQLSLESCWKTKASVISGGEQQRVALLRALVSNPRMLLLDEPFSALDVNLREEARLSVKSVIEKLEIPVLMITHDINDVKALAQQTHFMENGKIK